MCSSCAVVAGGQGDREGEWPVQDLRHLRPDPEDGECPPELHNGSAASAHHWESIPCGFGPENTVGSVFAQCFLGVMKAE